MGVLNNVYQGVAGVADAAAGSTDEAFARQFDDTAGGGLRAGFGEELGSSRDSFLTGIGQAVGVAPRGTAAERQAAAGPGIAPSQPDDSPGLFGGSTTAKAVAAVVGIGLLLFLLRPVLQIGAGVAN